jgi:rubredoxin
MNEHKCKLCNTIFLSKQTLQNHENKKRKCNVPTEFKCAKCNKFFAQKKNLTYHTQKDACKLNIIVNDADINNTLLEILNDNSEINDKIFFIKKITSNTDEEIKKILESKYNVNSKIVLLNNKKNVQTINNNTMNTTNNIQFNNFGNENIEYFNDNYLKKLINTVSSANKIGAESVFLKLSNEIYLNEQHPENQTIKIDNLNNKFCKIKKNNKWITADKNESLKKIFNRACEIVSMCIMDNKDMYKEAQLETINGYIEKDFDDEIIIETVKKLALDIYNFYNSTI